MFSLCRCQRRAQEQQVAAPQPTPNSGDDVPVTPVAKQPGGGKLCPITGLIGACPMARPKAPLKEGEKAPPLKVLMCIIWEEDASKVSVGVYPHMSEHWAAMELPDTSSKEEIRAQFKKLSIKYHPDKNPENREEAAKRFAEIKEAYDALKETNGELAFPWDAHPERQHEMTGKEVIRTFGFLGEEACAQDPIKAQFMQHVVKEATECKVLMLEKESVEDGQRTKETWADGLCVDSRTGANHLVKVYRRIVSMDSDEEGGIDVDDIDTVDEVLDKSAEGGA